MVSLWSTLDLGRAASNVTSEFKGDWYKDPWGWPELRWLAADGHEAVFEDCRSSGARRVALLDVPKENWGTRPAVVLDIVDRLMYQSLIDSISLPLIGGLPADVYGWRLAPVAPTRARYQSNKIQWDSYRGRLRELASVNSVALKSDIVSFFASVTTDVLSECIQDRVSPGVIADRLISFLEGSQRPTRSGLPQRSLASAILANVVLGPLDDVLLGYRLDAFKGTFFESLGPGFTRWMDDIWLFLDDPAKARQAQRDLQHAAHTIGLHLNSAKTDLLEGDRVAEEALLIEHSAIDEAIEDDGDFGKLEEMIDRILDDPDHIGRTTVKFVVSRLLKHKTNYKTDELLAVAHRMPHVADSLARLFKARMTSGLLQDWFLEYCDSDWSSFPWAIAQYSRMFASGTIPRRATREFFMERLSDANTELPLLAVAVQRLARWDAPQCRSLASDALRRADNPQPRRVLALGALCARATRRSVRLWLGAEPENRTTLKFLESCDFHAPPVRPTYAR
ncbi:MAG: hypothetical protein DLM59_04410 [Pseudonocardiales bacterium]|nr:MAG: hypothetical protein DLM59_04410 [Pseudonocardiales bacterium]